MKTTTLRFPLLLLLSVVVSNAIAQRAGDAVTFPEPQVTTLTLLGTSDGSHHMAPHFENLRTANWIYTATNTTVVWIKEEHAQGKLARN